MRYWILLAVITLSGCGQKGDLYRPSESVKPVEPQANMATTQGQPQG